MTSMKQVLIRSTILSLLLFSVSFSASAESYVRVPGVRGESVLSPPDSQKVASAKIVMPDGDRYGEKEGRGTITLTFTRSKAASQWIAEVLQEGEFSYLELIDSELDGRGKEHVGYTWVLKNVSVKSYSTSGASSDSPPREEITLNYETIEPRY